MGRHKGVTAGAAGKKSSPIHAGCRYLGLEAGHVEGLVSPLFQKYDVAEMGEDMDVRIITEATSSGNRKLVINKNRPVVSVVIVNYNGGPLLTEAVKSALLSTVEVEVLVSDNGSTDGSLSPLQGLASHDSRLSIIENQRNLGFARASNIAMKSSRGEYILLLNPDAVIKPDTLTRLLGAFAACPQAGVVGCLLRNPDGTEQAGCRRSIPTPWRSLVRVLHLDGLFPGNPRFRNFVLSRESLPEKPIFVEAISGAFMLVRREVMEQVGLLDEGYFLHCEDLDWCMRFRQAGWQILFVPDVAVVHYKGTCSAASPIRVSWYKHKGMVRFYHKFFRHQYPSVLMALVVVVVWSRFTLLTLANIARKFWIRSPAPDRMPQELSSAEGDRKISETQSIHAMPAVEMPVHKRAIEVNEVVKESVHSR